MSSASGCRIRLMRSFRKAHCTQNVYSTVSLLVYETMAIGWAFQRQTVRFYLIPAILQTRSSFVETSVSYREIDARNLSNPVISSSLLVGRRVGTAFTVLLFLLPNWTTPPKTSAVWYKSATRLWKRRSSMHCYRRVIVTFIAL